MKPTKKIAKRTPYAQVVERLIAERDPVTLAWAASGVSYHAVQARSVAKRLKVKLPKRVSEMRYPQKTCAVLAPKPASPDAETLNAGKPHPNVNLLHTASV